MRDYPLFEVGARYLLFLVPDDQHSGEYYTVGAYQGVFPISAGGSVRSLVQDSSSTAFIVHDTVLSAVLTAIASASPSP